MLLLLCLGLSSGLQAQSPLVQTKPPISESLTNMNIAALARNEINVSVELEEKIMVNTLLNKIKNLLTTSPKTAEEAVKIFDLQEVERKEFETYTHISAQGEFPIRQHIKEYESATIHLNKEKIFLSLSLSFYDYRLVNYEKP